MSTNRPDAVRLLLTAPHSLPRRHTSSTADRKRCGEKPELSGDDVLSSQST